MFYFLRTPLTPLTIDLENALRRKQPRDRMPVSRAQLDREAAAAGLRVRRIFHVRRFLSPQCYVLFEPAGTVLKA